MKKLFLITLAVATAFSLDSCKDHDDFEFSGVVIDYEMCTSLMDMGYAVQLSTPDSVGGEYLASDGMKYKNVVVVYRADRMLHDKDSIGGRIYWDLGHSETECNYHYRESTGDVPEASFSKIIEY